MTPDGLWRVDSGTWGGSSTLKSFISAVLEDSSPSPEEPGIKPVMFLRIWVQDRFTVSRAGCYGGLEHRVKVLLRSQSNFTPPLLEYSRLDYGDTKGRSISAAGGAGAGGA